MMNPFKYSGVVGRGAFCNRKQELHDLLRTMVNGEQMIMYSERRFGKTSLVERALANLPRDKYLAIYADLWSTDGEESFIAQMAAAISTGVASTSDKVLDTAKRLFGSFAPAISVDASGNPQLTFTMGTQGAKAISLREVLDVPEIQAKRRKRRAVVVMDEFQRILEYDNDRVERTLRSIIQHHQRVSYIFLGSRKHLIRSMFLDQDRPLYRSGAHYPLGPIATEHWKPFIRSRFRRTDREISDESMLGICGMTEGHPFYTQHLCHVVWELCPRGKRVTKRMITDATDVLLDRESYAYTALWESLGVNQRRFLIGLAHEPRGVKVYGSDFLRRHGLRSPSVAQRVVESLLAKDVIDRDNGSFLIGDRFFRLWIQKVTPPYPYGV